jgi:hypothetical protein
VVLLDRIDHPAVQFVADGQINTLLHMGKNDQGAHGGGQFIMKILPCRHVFREVLGLHQLSDVMEIGGNPAERCIGSDFLGASFSEVGHRK